MNKKETIQVMIIQVPVEVAFECDKCYWPNEIKYDEMVKEQGSYPGDWHSVKCENCGTEYDIDSVEWD